MSRFLVNNFCNYCSNFERNIYFLKRRYIGEAGGGGNSWIGDSLCSYAKQSDVVVIKRRYVGWLPVIGTFTEYSDSLRRQKAHERANRRNIDRQKKTEIGHSFELHSTLTILVTLFIFWLFVKQIFLLFSGFNFRLLQIVAIQTVKIRILLIFVHYGGCQLRASCV